VTQHEPELLSLLQLSWHSKVLHPCQGHAWGTLPWHATTQDFLCLLRRRLPERWPCLQK
jgi:hypothetical protein